MIICHNFEHYPSSVPLEQMQTEGWIHLTDPSLEECVQVQKKFKLHLRHLKAALDYNERPRLECEDDLLLILLRAPAEQDKLLKRPLTTFPAAFILRGNLLITVCAKQKTSERLLNQPIAKHGSRTAVMLMLSLFMRICSAFISNLQLLDEFVGKAEFTMRESMQNKELLQMLHVDKSLIYFMTALKGNQAVLEKLKNGSTRNATPQEKETLDDVMIENKQAIDMTDIYSAIIGSIGDTVSGMVSNNLNKVMKMLTGLTIVFMVPTIISSLYGMNVPLPGEDMPYSFAVLGVICLCITAVVYFILKKKDWM